MHYIIQENLFREYHFNTLIEYLERYNLTYEIVKYRPFTDELEFKTKEKKVFFFGSINAAKVAEKHGWNPGVFYNDAHDFEEYAKHWGEHMLNADAIIQDFGDVPEDIASPFFIRPTKDTKSFTSKVYHRDEWEAYIRETKREDQLERSCFEHISQETRMLIASPKEVQQEIRCWIVDGEPVTMSQYKIGRRVNMLNMDHNQEAYIFSKQMAKKFSPSRAYVMDICLYEDDYKIVEINCINCSGFYDGNMSKLIQSLENSFNDAK